MTNPNEIDVSPPDKWDELVEYGVSQGRVDELKAAWVAIDPAIRRFMILMQGEPPLSPEILEVFTKVRRKWGDVMLSLITPRKMLEEFLSRN